MAEQVSSLIVRLIDQVTGPARSVATALSRIGKSVQGARGSVTFADRLDAAMARNTRRIDTYRGQMVDAIATVYALGRAIGAPVNASRKFEAAFADVKKVVEFPTEGPYSASAFRKSLIDLSRRVPLSVEELTQIAAAGGQAGVALDELAGFTENVAQVATAFEISTEESGKALANLKAALKLSNPEVMLLADHMNVLANNMATSERQVLDVVNRVGALGEVVGVKAKDVAALGSAMTSAGADAESAGTAIRNLFLNLAQGSGMTKEQAGAMKRLGLDAKSFPKRMQAEGMVAVVDVLERVAKLPKDQQASTLTDLFDKRAVDAIGPLLNNLDLLRQALGLVADDTANAGASQREFEKRIDNFDAKMKMFGNTMNAMNIALGDALIPALTTILEKLTPIITAIGSWAEKNPQLAASIVGVTAGLLALNAALIAFKYVGALGFGGLLSMTKGVTTFATGVHKAAAGQIALSKALAGMSGANMTTFTTMGAGLRGMAQAVPGLSGLATAMTSIGAALATISAPVWLGIAAAVALVAAAAYSLWYYWDRISSFVGGFASTLMTELQPAFAALEPVMEPIAGLARAIGSGYEWASQKISDFMGWLSSVFEQETLTDGQKEAYRKSGSDLAEAMITAIKTAFNELLAWFSELPSRIVAAIGSIDLSGILKWPSMPSWLGGGGGGGQPSGVKAAPGDAAAMSDSIDGRARGGPVTRGKSYLVGEHRPEIFTPSQNGYIGQVGKGGGGTTISPTFNISISGNADASTVENIRRVLRDEVRQAFRGVYADAGLRFT
jgi:TP901 family phage tail tape measure protein